MSYEDKAQRHKAAMAKLADLNVQMAYLRGRLDVQRDLESKRPTHILCASMPQDGEPMTSEQLAAVQHELGHMRNFAEDLMGMGNAMRRYCDTLGPLVDEQLDPPKA